MARNSDIRDYLAAQPATKFPTLPARPSNLELVSFFRTVYADPIFEFKRVADQPAIYRWNTITRLWVEEMNFPRFVAKLLRMALKHSNPAGSILILERLHQVSDIHFFAACYIQTYPPTSFDSAIDPNGPLVPLNDGHLFDVRDRTSRLRTPADYYMFTFRTDSVVSDLNCPLVVTQFINQITGQDRMLARQLLTILAHQIFGHSPVRWIIVGRNSGRTTLFRMIEVLLDHSAIKFPHPMLIGIHGSRHTAARLAGARFIRFKPEDFDRFDDRIFEIVPSLCLEMDRLPSSSVPNPVSIIKLPSQFVRDLVDETPTRYREDPEILSKLVTSSAMRELFELLVAHY